MGWMASMTAANVLMLTDAAPAQVVDGPLRPIQLGKLTIAFQFMAASKLYWAWSSGLARGQAGL